MNPRLAQCISIALATLALRWLFIGLYGVDIPYWDQWDSPYIIIQGYHSGSLDWSLLFASHNEHRPVSARALTLGLLSFFGNWSPVREMAINSLIPALSSGLWSYFTLKDHPIQAKKSTFLLLFGVLLFASPMVGKNMLWSFQLPFFIFILAALITTRLAAKRDLSLKAWMIILSLTLLAQFGLASGCFVVLIAGLLRLLQALLRKDAKPAFEGAILLALGLTLFFILKVSVPGHEALQVQSFQAFLLSCWFTFGWPNKPFEGIGLILLWLPTLIIAFRIRNQLLHTAHGRFYLGLLAFVGANALAIVLFRGGTGTGPSPRHADIFLFGFVPAFWIFQEAYSRLQGRWRLVLLGLLIALPLLVVVRSYRDHEKLIKNRERREANLQLLREVRVLGHSKPGQALEMLEAVPLYERIYPDSEVLLQRILEDQAPKHLPPGMFSGQGPHSWIDRLYRWPGIFGCALLSIILALFSSFRRKGGMDMATAKRS